MKHFLGILKGLKSHAEARSRGGRRGLKNTSTDKVAQAILNMTTPPLVVYVDVDDTLIRTAGSKRIPVSGVAQHVKALAAEGAIMYCWSSGGAAYAQEVAQELGIDKCFAAFLPKPHVLLDDQDVSKWRRLTQVHPGRCSSQSVDDYWQQINKRPGSHG